MRGPGHVPFPLEPIRRHIEEEGRYGGHIQGTAYVLSPDLIIEGRARPQVGVCRGGRGSAGQGEVLGAGVGVDGPVLERIVVGEFRIDRVSTCSCPICLR